MINQLLGPAFNLIGDGGYGAWTIGTWFVLKYANLVIFVIVAGLFLLGMFINLPEAADEKPMAGGHHAGRHVAAAATEEGK